MTISNTTVEHIYQGNGSQTIFAVPFSLQNNSEIEVTLRDETDPAAPVITAQVLTTHYTLTGGPPATNVVMNSAPGAAVKILIRRVIPKTQTADYIANGPFPADQHEATLDKIVMQVQELSNALTRVPYLNKTVPLTSISPALPQPVDSGIWAWDVTGTSIEFIDPTTLLGVLGGFSDPMVSRGDIIYRDASNNTVRLGRGTASQVLTSDGTDIGWQTPPVAVASLAAVGTSPNANAGTVTAGVLNLEPADATHPGVVTELAQTFGGNKTFNDALIANLAFYAKNSAVDNTTTGANASIPLPASTGIRLTNSSLSSVTNLVASTDGRILVLINDTTGTIVIRENTGGAAGNRFITGTGADLTLADGAALLLWYDTVNSKWRIIGGAGGGGAVDPTTTLGDLLVNDGTTLDRLPIGTDNYVLTADSLNPLGMNWKVIPAGFADPMTTRGDIMIRNSSNVTARLGVGTIGQMLSTDGTDIFWDDAFIDPMTTRGDIVIRNASNVSARLAVGSSGKFLQSDGTDIAYSAVTLPLTTTINQILYSSAGNTVAGLATANSGALVTSATGVPSIAAAGADGNILRRAGTTVAFGSIDLADTDAVGTTILPLANGGSAKALTAVLGGIVYTDADSMEVLAAGTSGYVLQSNGAAAPTWVPVAGGVPTQFGTRGTPRSVVAATGITTGASHMSNSATDQDIYVEGSTGAESICATISVGTVIGQCMTIIGRNNAQLLTLDDTTTNIDINGSIQLGVGQSIKLKWDGTNWYEVSRRG
jgi:hypothetical protein